MEVHAANVTDVIIAHSHETDPSVLSKNGKAVSYNLNHVVLLLSRDHVD